MKLNDTFKLILIATLTFYAYLFLCAHLNPVVYLKLKLLDSLYQRYFHRTQMPPKDTLPIVIASIDDTSLKVLKKRWPWPRSVYADFLQQARATGPQTIAFDLSFSVPAENPEEDKLFSHALRKSGNVILGTYYGSGAKALRAVDILEASAWGSGFLNFPRDPDNTNRRLYPSRSTEDLAYAFSLSVAAHYKNTTPEIFHQTFYGDSSPEGVHWIPYQYRAKDFQTIPFWKWVQGQVKPSQIKGKIVLVGVTGEIFHDIYNTPLGIMPGVVLQANQIMNYLKPLTLREMPSHLANTVLLALFLGLGVLFYHSSILRGGVILLGMGVLVFYGSYAFFERGWVWDVFSSLVVTSGAYLLAMLYRSIRLFIENRGLRYQTKRDPLTDLYTYRYLDHCLKAEFDKAKESTSVLSFVIFDLDRFKGLNDTYGHEKGNEVLLAFVEILKTFSRQADIVARYGGEEFCILLPQTQEAEALKLADRIRSSLSEKEFFFVPKNETEPRKVGVTVSAGIAASSHTEVFNGKELLRLADAALLAAKEKGRNCVCIHGNSTLLP